MELPVQVVAAVIEENGRFLVARRPSGSRHGGLWEFPGGKVKPGESLADALARELAEELGLVAVTPGQTLFIAIDRASGFAINFIEASVAGEPEAREHSELRWAAPADLAALPLAPTDGQFVRQLLERHSKSGE